MPLVLAITTWKYLILNFNSALKCKQTKLLSSCEAIFQLWSLICYLCRRPQFCLLTFINFDIKYFQVVISKTNGTVYLYMPNVMYWANQKLAHYLPLTQFLLLIPDVRDILNLVTLHWFSKVAFYLLYIHTAIVYEGKSFSSCDPLFLHIFCDSLHYNGLIRLDCF